MMNPKAVYDKVASLEDRVRQLESERKQRIDALKEAETWIKNLPKYQFRTHGDDMGIKLFVRDDVLEQIKTALRNAGMEDL